VAAVTTHSLDGLPFPDRPQSDRPHRVVGQIVIVQPGDTLWAIARRSLPDGASDAETAQSCDEWFAANRAVIGNDPDLIVPAQRLHPPTKEHS
jgi:nucleoid-associated protein YgaU